MTTTVIPPAPAEPATLGAAYHRIAANDRPRWWRALFSTLAVLAAAVAAQVAVFAVAWIATAIAGGPVDKDGLPVLPDAVETAAALAGIALTLPIVLVAARLLQSRPAGTLSSVLGRLRWGWLVRCVLLMVATMVTVVVGAVALLMATEPGAGAGGDEPQWLGLGTVLAASAMFLVIVPLQAAAEEYLFRGWLIQTVGANTRSLWPVIAIQAVLFSLAHGFGTPWGFLDLIAFGVIAGWLTVRTGGLEAAIALHVVNNLTWALFGAATGTLTIDETAADMPWQVVIVDVLALAAYAAAVSWLARRRNVATTTPVTSEAVTAEPITSQPITSEAVTSPAVPS